MLVSCWYFVNLIWMWILILYPVSIMLEYRYLVYPLFLFGLFSRQLQVRMLGTHFPWIQKIQWTILQVDAIKMWYFKKLQKFQEKHSTIKLKQWNICKICTQEWFQVKILNFGNVYCITQCMLVSWLTAYKCPSLPCLCFSSLPPFSCFSLLPCASLMICYLCFPLRRTPGNMWKEG